MSIHAAAADLTYWEPTITAYFVCASPLNNMLKLFKDFSSLFK